MRKYLYAGVVAGGLLLLGAAPAHADVIPAPINAQQDGDGTGGGLLGPDGALGMDNPLDGTRVLNIDPGQNTPDLTGPAGGLLPAEGAVPAARTGMGQATSPARPELPNPPERPDVADLPVLGQTLAGLLPEAPMRESATFADNMSVLGALGGLLPISEPRTLPAYSGMPAGGTTVPPTDGNAVPARPADAADPAVDAADPARGNAADPAADVVDPARGNAADPAVADDARLHEEPVDPEAKPGRTRSFSDGRPVAGVDDEYR